MPIIPTAKKNESTTTMIRWMGCANKPPPVCRVLTIGILATYPAMIGSEKRAKAMNRLGT